MIEAAILPDGAAQYRNSGYGRSRGVELELNKKAGQWLEAGASYACQQTFNTSDPARSRPDNVPVHLVKARAAVPLGSSRFWAAAGFQYTSSRLDYQGDTQRPVALADVTFTTRNLSRSFDLAAGVRNLLGWRYSDPVDLGVASMPQNGRSAYITLIYHARE